MKSKLKQKIVAIGLAAMMFVGITPATVFASDDPSSKEKLEIMVNEEVDKINFSNLGIDQIINGINNTITNTVTGTVNSILTTENIKAILKPVIKGLVSTALGNVQVPPQIDVEKIIDDALNNQIVDKILTSQFTQEVIARTVEYTVSDIMDIVKIPTIGEVIETSKEELALNTVEYIWNANDAEKKLAYYEYEIKLEGWKPVSVLKGWKRVGIATKLQLDLLKIVGDNAQAPDLSSINYEEVIANAARRAVRDIVNEKITEVKVTINTAIQNKIVELKAEAEKAIKDAINQSLENIKNKFPKFPWRPY